MRDHHFRTLHKDHESANRKLKWSTEHSTTPKKIVKKCLNSVLTTASEDVLIESAKDSIDISTICEISDDNQVNESLEDSVNSSSVALSPSIASPVSDLSPMYSTITSDALSISSDYSPLSSATTSEKVQTNNVRVNRGSMKAEIFAKKFRQAGTQSLKPNDMIILSENVMEVLLRAVIEDLHNLPEKRDWFIAIVEKKVYVVLEKVFSVILTFMLLIIVVGVLVFSTGDGGSYHELVPT